MTLAVGCEFSTDCSLNPACLTSTDTLIPGHWSWISLSAKVADFVNTVALLLWLQGQGHADVHEITFPGMHLASLWSLGGYLQHGVGEKSMSSE